MWLISPVSTVPPLPVPLVPEETQVPHSAECHRPMQPLPARPEERVAADLPHFGCLALHPPHQHPQTPGQDRWLRGLRSGGQFVALYLSQLRVRMMRSHEDVFNKRHSYILCHHGKIIITGSYFLAYSMYLHFVYIVSKTVKGIQWNAVFVFLDSFSIQSTLIIQPQTRDAPIYPMGRY